MQPHSHPLGNGRTLVIREAEEGDARELLDHVEAACNESDFLTMGPGEFKVTEEQERTILRAFRDTDNHLYIVGLIDDAIVAMLAFAGGTRQRIRHTGEFSMTVRKEYWSLGIGSLLLDELIDWAAKSGIVKKINLRVRDDHDRAIALYERKGFATEGIIRGEVLLDGRYYDHRCMGRAV